MRLRSIVLGLVAACGAPQSPGGNDADVGPPGVVEIADVFCSAIGSDSISASVSVDVALEVGEVFGTTVSLVTPPETSTSDLTLSCFPWDPITDGAGETQGCQRGDSTQPPTERLTYSYSETSMFGDLPTPVALSIGVDVRSMVGGAVIASDSMGVPCD